MVNTETLIQRLESGPISELTAELNDDPQRVNTFLSQPADHGNEQWMPMHFAARAGHLEAVEALLTRGVHPDCRTRFTTPMHARQTSLHLAAIGGHGPVIQRLFEAVAEVEVRDAQQRSPLWLAARHHHAEVVTQLARRGADLEARDAQGRTPLHAALLPAIVCKTQNNAEALPTLPAQPVQPVQEKQSVFDPHPALILLRAGADPNATCSKDPEGYTPLHRCVALGSTALDLAQALLDSGADPAAADPRHSRTPADFAQHLHHQPYRDLLCPS